MAQTKAAAVFVSVMCFNLVVAPLVYAATDEQLSALILGTGTVRTDNVGTFHLPVFCNVCTGEILMSFAREASRAIRSTLVLWVIGAIIYPFVMIAFGQILFPFQANGSLVKNNAGQVGVRR